MTDLNICFPYISVTSRRGEKQAKINNGGGRYQFESRRIRWQLLKIGQTYCLLFCFYSYCSFLLLEKVMIESLLILASVPT
jgi:hypothetical protein